MFKLVDIANIWNFAHISQIGNWKIKTTENIKTLIWHRHNWNGNIWFGIGLGYWVKVVSVCGILPDIFWGFLLEKCLVVIFACLVEECK